MARTNGPVEITLDREEVEVTLKSGQSERKCALREMDGFERDKYLNEQRTKLDKASQSLKDYTDVQTSLIAMCLIDKSTGDKLTVQEIRQFPSRQQAKLYDLCMEINGLNVNAEEAAKNS